MNLIIRPETPADFAATENIARQAFAPDESVAELVRRLRQSDALIAELNLVAEIDGAIAGHIMFTRAAISSGHTLALLSPLGVLPDFQKRGVGAALVNHALSWLHNSDFPLSIVEGIPEYYPRFGFESAHALGVLPPYDLPAPPWMALRLPHYTSDVCGVVRYAPEFDFLAH